MASGHVIADMTPRHRAREFRRFLDLIDEQVPDELDVHVVLDNVATHRTAEIQRWLLGHPRFQSHFTPTYSSWMNLIERWFSELTTKWPRSGAHRSVAELTCAVEHWVAGLERRRVPLRLAQDRRSDLRQPRRISQPDSRLRKLAGC